jgi:lipoate---protein ligase
MVRVLRVPDEKFRDKIHKTLRDNLTTIRRELGEVPARDELWDMLAEEFAKLLGSFDVATAVDVAWRQESDHLAATMLKDEWLHQSRPTKGGRAVKIRDGVEVHHKAHKAPGGLIRAVVEFQEGHIVNAALSGDFFFYPAELLQDMESALVDATAADVEAVVAKFYADHGIESPGVTPADFALVIG